MADSSTQSITIAASPDQVAAVIRREKDELDEDAILNELLYIKERINKSSRILTDKKMTAFFFVLTAEEMIINDTLKAAELFAKFEVPLSGYIINRVLPAELKDQNIPEYLKNRITMQEHYLKVIDNPLQDVHLAAVLRSPIYGITADELAQLTQGT